jgi:predicted exporter
LSDSTTVAAQSSRGPRVPSRWALAALAWLAFVCVVAAHQWQFWREGRLTTDVLELLPATEHAPEVTRATRVLADRVSRQIVVLIGAPDWNAARRAADRWRAALAQAQPPMKPHAEALPDADAVLAFYAPWHDRLLTPAQRQRLQATPPAALVQSALVALHQPGAGARLQDWAADPLGLWPEWLMARARQSNARPRDGELWVSGEGREWVVAAYDITGSPFAMNGDAVYSDAMRAATEAARGAVPDVQVVTAGLPLFAEAAAVRASHEINTVGWGSLAAVLLLAWLAFRGVTPIALTALSLVVGTAAAVSVTAWIFGELHLITLVFGASLVGVAEDYGIHYFASRQAQPWVQPRSMMRSLLPGLVLALATSVLAYLALGLAPFPGLRQMAVFSAAGLLGAFITAACWFPFLDRGRPRESAFAAAIARSLDRWPRALPSWRLVLVVSVIALLCVAGIARVRVLDDVRHWQGSPAQVLESQMRVGKLLGVPSVAQFYLVRGDTPEQLLQREEALKREIDAVVASGGLSGYAAVSDWLPSQKQQKADAQLTAVAEAQVLAGVNSALGESIARPAPRAGALTPDDWLASRASLAARNLWLGQDGGQWGSVVMLQGLHDAAVAAQLGAIAQRVEGVRWVDKASEVSALLARYRHWMTLLLIGGHVAVFAALWWRYRAAAWRAWLPTAAATVITVGLLGWMGEPMQLSTVLALLLLLGIGVDYGIFLCEHEGDGAAWLAVVIGAASTWLSFGLLSLSSTPALHAFGLALLLGVGIVWMLSPWLRPAGRRVAEAA